MKRFVDRADRPQALLLPDRVDDYVHQNSPVRLVDAFVDALYLGELGFKAASRAAGGRPAYHPAALLKIYMYGYLNRVRSIHRLEHNAQRNLEVIWLTGRLVPDFKTIDDFRKDNGAAIVAVCGRFTALCRRMKVFSLDVVVIDGSKFKVVNSRDRNFTVGKIKARRSQPDESVACYLAELDRADRDPVLLPEARISQLRDKLAKLREQMAALDCIERGLQEAPDIQISLTDPDARSMTWTGRATGTVGYNLQAAVDAEHHLIVAEEVTNIGHDRTQLAPMGLKFKAALGADHLTALADRGYYNAHQILGCEQNGIIPLVLKPLTSNSKAEGASRSGTSSTSRRWMPIVVQPASRPRTASTSEENGLTLHKYWSSATSVSEQLSRLPVFEGWSSYWNETIPPDVSDGSELPSPPS